MEKEKILEFYKQTSQFTDLGYYKDFAKTCQMILKNYVYYKECK